MMFLKCQQFCISTWTTPISLDSDSVRLQTLYMSLASLETVQKDKCQICCIVWNVYADNPFIRQSLLSENVYSKYCAMMMARLAKLRGWKP